MQFANTLLGAIWVTGDSFFFLEHIRQIDLGLNNANVFRRLNLEVEQASSMHKR
jgi:hypothetical protein